MKIERGIIGFNNHNEMIVDSPGHIYHLNNEGFYSQSLAENNKVLGVIVNNKFSVCREFISTTGHFVFGYIDSKSDKQAFIQSIENFNVNTFDPFLHDFELGKIFEAEIE